MTVDNQEMRAAATALREAFARPERADEALDEFGWTHMADELEHEAVSLLFTAQGAAAGTSGALAWVVARPLLDALGIPALDARPSTVLPEPGGAVRVGAGKVTVDGVALPGRDDRAVLAGVDDAGQPVVAAVAWRPEPAGGGMDTAFRGARLLGHVVEGEVAEIVTGEAAASAIEAARAAGRRALAHELNGVMLRMLELATEHACLRTQFGAPIGSYQAVQHRLAEARVRLQGSWDVADAAWDDRSPHAATVAKALAGRTLRIVSSHCQQVLAGMGFTGEHFFATLFRHGLVRDTLLGSGADLRRALGEEIAARRTLLDVPVLGLDVPDSLARIDLFRSA